MARSVVSSAQRQPSGSPRRRLVVAAFGLLVAAYFSVFLADGAAWSWGVVLDALANAVALGVIALGVRALTQRVRWSAASRWWFFPLHLAGALLAAELSLAVTGFTLGLSAWLRFGQLTMTWLEGPARHWQLFTVVFAYAAVAGSCYVLQVADEAREADALRQEAALARLRARLDPHVLLNTLHSLLELVRSDDRVAEEAIDRFGRVVRYVSAPREGRAELVPLREEWAHLEDYLYLEQLRLGERLVVDLHLETDVAGSLLPAVSLQPLVENAVVHGVAPRPGRGTVAIRATRDGDTVRITVTDDGIGTTQPPTSGAGTGLSLVRARLEAHFGRVASLAAGAGAEGRGWTVTMRVPA